MKVLRDNNRIKPYSLHRFEYSLNEGPNDITLKI